MTPHDALLIFPTLARAGISISCFAKLTGISRQTLQSWKAGKPVSDELRWKIAYNTAIRAKRAVDAGLLPLPQEPSAAEKVVIVKRILLSV